MCGIAGKLCWRPDPEALGALGNMLARIAHRGPDASRLHTEVAGGCAVGLAHARLSIIDLSARARQPMCNENGTVWLVYNGEIYNYVSLARELERRGHRFESRSDSEVIVHGYEEWGLGLLDRLEGMFAFAIWDRRQQQLLCARDPAGIKPLYWCSWHNSIWFASEIKALLADPAVPHELDQQGLAHFLAYGHGVAPVTAFRHIYKLQPGHLLVAREGAIRTSAYWDVRPDPAPNVRASAAADMARAGLEAAVQRHMVSDVPVGAFLSGGLDSSAVVALMSRLAPGPIRTFCAGFAEPGYDERASARLVAAHFGTAHEEIEVSPADFQGSLGAVAWHYDEPFADAAAVPLFLLSRAARAHVKVVLTGEGSDELFAGYRRISVERLARCYGLLPRPARRWLAAAVRRLPRLRRVKQALSALALDDPAERYACWLTLFDAPMRADLLMDPAAAACDVLAHYRQKVHPRLDPVTRALYCDFKTWLPDTYLEKVDKATMAHGLEARVPFLDRRLVEFAFTLPPGLKIRGLDTKHVLKQALRGILPPAIYRRAKHGFAVPLDAWFRGALRDLVQSVITDSRTRQRGLLRPAYLEQLARDHWTGSQVRSDHLYAILMLELWCRTVVDGAPAQVTL